MAKTRWQLQEAKNRLSEVVRKAQTEGPQVITRHGADAAVVVSAAEYRKRSAARGRLVDFFRKSPLVGAHLKLLRALDTGKSWTGSKLSASGRACWPSMRRLPRDGA